MQFTDLIGDGNACTVRSFDLSALHTQWRNAARTRGRMREYTSHRSQVGCRGMSSEEFSRAPRSRCQTEYAFVTATSASCEPGDRPRAAVTLRGIARRERRAPQGSSSRDRAARRRVAFRKRSHSTEGSRAFVTRGNRFSSLGSV